MNIDVIQTILTPIFVILVTQGVKKISAIPISAGQTAKLRTLVGVLSFGSTLLLAFIDGKLESVLSPELIEVGVNSIVVFILSHIGFKAAKAAEAAKPMG